MVNINRPDLSTYRSWRSMKCRCLYPSSANYRFYGGIGITFCDRWSNYANFLADMGLRPTETTLDRIDGTLGYEPGNCRWATRSEQNYNRRTRLLTRDQVTRIHELRGDGWSLGKLAKQFSAPKSYIGSICRGEARRNG